MSDGAVMPRGNAVGEVTNNMVMRNSSSTDGRNRRAAETRRKVIDAAKAMIAETAVAPTVVGVAKRANVSVRSVFQHFRDVESLFVTVVESAEKDVVVPPATPSDLPLGERVESFARNMAQIYEQIVSYRVAAGQFVGHPALQARSQLIHGRLREAASRVFNREFGTLTLQAREELADAIAASLSLESWAALRRLQNLGFERAVATWQLTLGALLAHPMMPVAV